VSLLPMVGGVRGVRIGVGLERYTHNKSGGFD